MLPGDVGKCVGCKICGLRSLNVVVQVILLTENIFKKNERKEILAICAIFLVQIFVIQSSSTHTSALYKDSKINKEDKAQRQKRTTENSFQSKYNDFYKIYGPRRNPENVE